MFGKNNSLVEVTLLSLGVISISLGIAALLVPGISLGLVLSKVVVLFVSLAALSYAVYAIYLSPYTRSDILKLPYTDQRADYNPPGYFLLERLDDVSWGGRDNPDTESRREIRDDLRETAFEFLTLNTNRSEASRMIENGEWTDDPIASEYFTDDLVPETSFRDNLRGFIRGETPFERRTKRTIREINKLGNLAVETESDTRNGTEENEYRYLDRNTRTVEVLRELSGDGDQRRVKRHTRRWRGVATLSLLAVALGGLMSSPAALIMGVFGIVFASYSSVVSPPDLSLRVEREITNTNPDSGDRVEVTVEVQNKGDSVLSNLRIADGVPPGLEVKDESSRFTTALRPDEKAKYSYTVEAIRGIHEFDPLLVIARDINGVTETVKLQDVEGDGLIKSAQEDKPASQIDLRSHVTNLVGNISADIEGSGVEFSSVRDYRSGDPFSRIDWNTKAKTNQLSTINFQETRTAKVMILVDARSVAYTSPPEKSVPAVERCIDATRMLFDGNLENGNLVGIGTLPVSFWIDPGGGEEHRHRTHELLSSSSALSWSPPQTGSEGFDVKNVVHRLSDDTQVVLFTPLCDDEIVGFVKQLDVVGHPVTVISPDTTTSAGMFEKFSRLRRKLRLRELRSAEIPVYDWSFEREFTEAVGEWSK